MTIEREEFTTRIKALTDEQKRIVATLLPMNILEAEQDKRYKTVTEILEDIHKAIKPFINGNICTYDDAITIIDNVVAALHKGEKNMAEETHEQLGETGRGHKGSEECSEDH